MSNDSDPTKPHGCENSGLVVGLIATVLVFSTICAFIRCSMVKRALLRELEQQAERLATLRVLREDLEARAAEELRRQDLLWHARVLAVLFPKKVTVPDLVPATVATMTDADDAGTATSESASDGNHLMYDPETQRYRWTGEFLADPTIHTCSICMEPLEQTDTLMTGRCDHTYHHQCMMGWLDTKLYKNDCPYCRQELWTWSEYDEISRELEQADKDAQVPTSAPCRERRTLESQ